MNTCTLEVTDMKQTRYTDQEFLNPSLLSTTDFFTETDEIVFRKFLISDLITFLPISTEISHLIEMYEWANFIYLFHLVFL